MTGTLIVSLDCEGKWGMADKISSAYDFITEKALARAYAELIGLFRLVEMHATFAFVGAFTLNETERVSYADLFRDTPYLGANWLRKYREAEALGQLDGWFCPDAHESAKEEGHEIASHGFSHVPFDDPATPLSELSADIAAAVQVAKAKGVRLDTFVFPRNRVAHLDILAAHGLRGFRERIGSVHPLVSFAREFAIFGASQKDGDLKSAMVAIPAGFFFNWRAGLRRRIPKAVTLARWTSILRSAERQDEVAHLWLHPHNIISGPETLEVLREVLIVAAQMRDEGRIKVLTQSEYSSRMLSRQTSRSRPAAAVD